MKWSDSMNKIRKKLLLTGFIAVMIVLAACSKKNKDTEETTTVPTETETSAPVTQAPTETETETEPLYIRESDALERVQKEIGERGYYFEIIENEKSIGDKVYYIVQVSDSSSAIEPNVLIDKVSGELLCYYKDGTTAPFEEFPLFTSSETESNENSTDTGVITKDEALSYLEKLSAKTLRLEKNLTEYTKIEFDAWTTYVNNVECYGINVYDKVNGQEQTQGVYYVSLDGKKIYLYDSVEEQFVELK